MVRSRRWGYVAAGWATLFAALHFFWALGGSAGLATSAGVELATERPDWVLLLSGALDGNSAIGPGQRYWTLVRWNPWFAAGGLAFGLATLGAARPDSGPS